MRFPEDFPTRPAAWVSDAVCRAAGETRRAAVLMTHTATGIVARHYWGNTPYTVEALSLVARLERMASELEYDADYLYHFGGA